MNEYLPANEQDIDRLEDTQGYENYLNECVETGAIDLYEAQEIIDGGKWHIVREMMGEGDLQADSAYDAWREQQYEIEQEVK